MARLVIWDANRAHYNVTVMYTNYGNTVRLLDIMFLN